LSVYITSTGAFLPGPPVDNDEMEEILGLVNGKKSRLKRRILKANGIVTRHYAIDKDHNTLFSASDMAVKAAERCLEQSTLSTSQVKMLSCATTQGDMVIPGFGSMVQADLGIPEVELHTTHGVCTCSSMAIKAAYNNIRVGDQPNALVVVSELASRLFKNTHYEAAGGSAAVNFNAEFLRWMLSDGAGSLLLENQPRGQCLRIDWIRSFSHADSYPVCMGIGAPTDPDDTRTWQDFPTYGEAEAHGALLIRQDIRLLETIVKIGVDGTLKLIEDGLLDTDKLDHLLCHYSSHHFKSRIYELLDMAGARVDEEKWYSNLYTRGNTGAASILIMLDEFLSTDRAKPGDTIICMVPLRKAMSEPVVLDRPDVLTDLGQETLRRLIRVWFDFERRLARVPIIRRLDLGQFNLEDYQNLLLNMRPQVVEGARWIARCASSFDRDHADVRSVIIGHAQDEHRDYEVLEADYVTSGGDLQTLQMQPRNPGSEALHCFLMYRAGQPNPVDLLGAMWIIEGLGEKMANDWAKRMEELIDGSEAFTKFLRYHGDNDDSHMGKLYGLVDRVCTDQNAADRIVRTAKVVARLYAMQLEEIEHV